MAGYTSFKALMEPGFVGSLRTRNRIVKTAAGTGYAKDGNPSEQMTGFYSAIARGGVGLLIIENCSVEWPRGTHFIPTGLRLHDDYCIPYHAEMVEQIHKHGCPVFLQLLHAGPWLVRYEGMGVQERVAPSTIPVEELPSDAWVPAKELTISEIQELVDVFAKAAERAKKAGYDGVEINGSYYHFINCFLSRFWNRRRDEYGCDNLENRTRLYCEIIREVKNRCGKDYPLATNINAVEFGLRNGITLDESKRIAPFLQAAGADLIQVRVTGYGDYKNLLLPEHLLYPEVPKDLDLGEMDISHGGRGIIAPLAAAIKKGVTVPVACAGRLDPVLGERYLQEQKLDFIGMTRRLIADPELPNKIATGRLEDIAPCAGCGYCSHSRTNDRPLKCRINASVGREQEYEIRPAKVKKKVLIIGGGLAGMEAARVAAARGHNVTLCEKERSLGGLLKLAAIVKGGEMDSLLDTLHYYETQIAKLGVTVELSKKVDAVMIRSIKPEVLVVGTGGVNPLPDIPGIENKKVVRNEDLHKMLKAALGFIGPKILARLTKIWMPVGKTVVIIGGAIQGCQLAHFLVKRGRKVTIVDSAKVLGDGLPYETPFRLFKWLREEGTAMYAGVTYKNINDKGLVIYTENGEEKLLQADSIIIALPSTPDTNVAKALGDGISEIFLIGDCREFGLMHGAVSDGSEIGHAI